MGSLPFSFLYNFLRNRHSAQLLLSTLPPRAKLNKRSNKLRIYNDKKNKHFGDEMSLFSTTRIRDKKRLKG